MSEAKGFWSYVRADDEAEGGRISQLARDIVAQYEMLTGETISLFLDRDDIEWGDRWREVIDTRLSSVAFFIAVLTPRYFLSVECRRELGAFARAAANLGVKELVMPLLYIEVPALSADAGGDDLIELIKTFQREDWREIRFLDRSSEGYRRAVGRLAQSLVEANRRADEAAVTAPRPVPVQETEDDTPGPLDRLGQMEESFPRLSETTQAIGAEISAINESMTEATAQIGRLEVSGKAFSGRLVVARQLSARLRPIAERLHARANDFAAQLNQVDDGVRTIIELAPREIEQDPNGRQVVCTFFEQIRALQQTADTSLGYFQQMIDAIKPSESMSRDLRAPLRRLREGLTILVEGREIMARWVSMIEICGVD